VDGFIVSTLLSPKPSVMQVARGVKPHQKLIAAGTLIDDAMDDFTACFCLSSHCFCYASRRE